MGSSRYQIVHYRYESRSGSENLVTTGELARLARLHPEMVDKLVDWGLIEPVKWEPKLLFPETTVPRIWRIMRLRRDLGINWSGIGVVLDLLDKIEELEREIAWLRKQL
ncbi:MAG: chaperone modulator CbpM [Syntrophobacteria bacterium]|jgi:DNA-binding transcriptional MerR regulator